MANCMQLKAVWTGLFAHKISLIQILTAFDFVFASQLKLKLRGADPSVDEFLVSLVEVSVIKSLTGQ